MNKINILHVYLMVVTFSMFSKFPVPGRPGAGAFTYDSTRDFVRVAILLIINIYIFIKSYVESRSRVNI